MAGRYYYCCRWLVAVLLFCCCRFALTLSLRLTSELSGQRQVGGGGGGKVPVSCRGLKLRRHLGQSLHIWGHICCNNNEPHRDSMCGLRPAGAARREFIFTYSWKTRRLNGCLAVADGARSARASKRDGKQASWLARPNPTRGKRKRAPLHAETSRGPLPRACLVLTGRPFGLRSSRLVILLTPLHNLRGAPCT